MAPLFIGAAMIESRRRRDYSVLRHPVSALALGNSGWIQTGNFLVGGALTCLFAIGLRRARPSSGPPAAPWLLEGAGLGLIGAAIWPTDPVNGYPPGVPDRMTQRTRTGIIHELCAVPVMLGIPSAALAAGVRSAAPGERRWGGYCVATAVVSLSAFFASGAGFGGREQFAGRAGLYQRIGIVTAFGWISMLALRVRRRLR